MKRPSLLSVRACCAPAHLRCHAVLEPQQQQPRTLQHAQPLFLFLLATVAFFERLELSLGADLDPIKELGITRHPRRLVRAFFEDAVFDNAHDLFMNAHVHKRRRAKNVFSRTCARAQVL